MNTLEQPALLQDLQQLPLTDVMSREVLTVYEGWSIKRLAGFFVKHNISGAPVVASDESLVGVVTQGDVVRFESREPTDIEVQKLVISYYGPNSSGLTEADLRRFKDRANETCTVNTIMTAQVVSIGAEASAAEACLKIVENNLHRLFVTENGRLVGVVTAMDILRCLVNS